MTRYRFDAFDLDLNERRLHRDGRPVELGGRYLDALALLVERAGDLVTKDDFLATVWRGVPVTDEALTQCIRALRRTLGDDAAQPRFIATVPRHGYRFVATVAASDADPAVALVDPAAVSTRSGGEDRWRRVLAAALAGTLGAGIAGAIGGTFYGSIAAAQSGGGAGATSVLLVVVWLTLAAALTGGAGVSVGIALAGGAEARGWQVAGGAAGGFLIGGIVRLLGVDAFHLLLGRAPEGITGALEGFALGGTVGAATWLSSGGSLHRRLAIAALVGAAGGTAILLAGGRLMGGSLALLSRTFPTSRLHLSLDSLAAIGTGALEGALFAAAIVGAMTLAQARASASAISPRDGATP